MPDSDLLKVTETEFKADIVGFLRRAKNGEQVAIVNNKGEIKTVLGMSKTRTLPESDYEPICVFDYDGPIPVPSIEELMRNCSWLD